MRNVVVALVVLLLVFGSYVVVTNMGLARSNPCSEEGEVCALDVSQASATPVVLTGGWTFYPATFIDPDEPPTSGGQAIDVPGAWQGKLTHGSYHVRLKGLEIGRHALLFDTVYTAYELYVDGTFLFGSGTISDIPENSVARFTDHTGEFDVTEEKPVDIVVLVSNFYHPVGGIGVAPIVGTAQAIERLHGLTLSTTVALEMIFLISALIILFFHGKLNKDRSILLFATLCISLALKVAASNSLVTLLIPSFPIGLISKIEYLTIPLAALAFMYYAMEVFSLPVSIWVRHLFQSLSGVYMLLIITSPIRFYYPLLFPYTVLMVLMLGYLLILMVLDQFGERRVSPLILLSACVMLATIAMQSIYYEWWVYSFFMNQVAAFGMSFFIMANFHAFSLRFLHAKQEALVAADLLEHKVSERTQQLHEANERLEWHASHDMLTNLLNRNELIRSYMGRPYQSPFAVAYMDLDNFKTINDRYSHRAGDIVLRLFGEHLRAHARNGDILFPVGGDEFIIILPTTDRRGAEAFANRLLANLRKLSEDLSERLEEELDIVFDLPVTAAFTASIGIAVQEEGRVDLDALVTKADALQVASKQRGKDCFLIDVVSVRGSTRLPI